jgi:hypothetical protein
MNVLNRLLGLLFLLLVLAAALATIGLVTDLLTVPAVRQVWAYRPVVTITHDVGHLEAGRWPWVLGGAIAAGLIALILLVRELTPPSRRARVLVLSGEGPGRTEVPYSALDELTERSAREVSGVERVRARVELRRRALMVRCQALVSPYVDLATIGPELQRTIANRLQHVTGLPVQTVRVRTTVQEERRQVR